MKRVALALLLLGIVYSQAAAQGTPPGMPVSPRLVNERLINVCSRVIAAGTHADERRLLELFEKARGFIVSGTQDQALSEADRGVDADPNSRNALIYRALILHANKKGNRAIKDLDAALAIDAAPESIVALTYFIRAQFQTGRGEPDRARKDLDAAISLNPGLAPAYSLRGHLLERRMRYDEAEADHDKAVTLDPQEPYVFVMRSNYRYGHGSESDAIADLDHAIALDPNDPVTYWLRGRIFFYKGDRMAAHRDFARADEIYSKLEAQ
jgi:tetratricopeptide (TPR) repeat protein